MSEPSPHRGRGARGAALWARGGFQGGPRREPALCEVVEKAVNRAFDLSAVEGVSDNRRLATGAAEVEHLRFVPSLGTVRADTLASVFVESAPDLVYPSGVVSLFLRFSHGRALYHARL